MQYNTSSQLDELLLMKSLKAKLSDGKALDFVLEQNPDSPDFQRNFKNVCTPLSKSVVERLESVVGLLDMSKRQFLEVAIFEAIQRAESIIQETRLIESFEERSAAIKAFEADLAPAQRTKQNPASVGE